MTGGDFRRGVVVFMSQKGGFCFMEIGLIGIFYLLRRLDEGKLLSSGIIFSFILIPDQNSF